MIDSIDVIGARGRVGGAVSERLAERGVVLDALEPELVLLCVPDRCDFGGGGGRGSRAPGWRM